MNRITFPILMLGLSLTFTLSGCSAKTTAEAEQPKEFAKTLKAGPIAAIEKLGGRVTVDEDNPGKPVIKVDFMDTEITDAGLENLRGLTQLQSLDLAGTKVTDAGLAHLKGLTKLQSLDLFRATNVTDAGLAHLKGLTELQSLNLVWTQVTNTGLEHLKGLAQLR